MDTTNKTRTRQSALTFEKASQEINELEQELMFGDKQGKQHYKNADRFLYLNRFILTILR